MRPCQPKVVFVRMFQAASSGSVALGDVTVGGEPGAPGVGELAVAAAAPEALASPGWAAAAAALWWLGEGGAAEAAAAADAPCERSCCCSLARW